MSKYEPVYLRDLDGTGSMHPCSKGDPGAVEYVPADAIQSLQGQVEELESKLTGKCFDEHSEIWRGGRNAALSDAWRVCVDREGDLLRLVGIAGTELAREAHHSAARECRRLAAAIRNMKAD